MQTWRTPRQRIWHEVDIALGGAFFFVGWLIVGIVLIGWVL